MSAGAQLTTEQGLSSSHESDTRRVNGYSREPKPVELLLSGFVFGREDRPVPELAVNYE